jgi:hypothetical protein
MPDHHLTVVRGTPDDASLAAVVSVLAALRAAAVPQATRSRSPWLGEPWRGGPDAWRLAGLPR